MQTQDPDHWARPPPRLVYVHKESCGNSTLFCSNRLVSFAKQHECGSREGMEAIAAF